MIKFRSLKGTASCLLLTAGALLLLAASSKATTESQFFAGFTEDWNVLEVAPTGNPQNAQVQNASVITGALGIASGEQVQFQQATTSIGAVYFNSNKPPKQYQNQGAKVGAVYYKNLNPDIAAASTLTKKFASLPTTSSGFKTSNSSLSNPLLMGSNNGQLNLNNNQNLTLTATSSKPVVFNIKAFTLNNGSTLTLAGNANSEFVFNIYGGNFSVNNHSQILLKGLTSADVVFNIVGNGGGPQINNNSTVYGNLVAPQQQVQINNHSLLVGAVISNGIQVNNGSEIESAKN